MKHSEYVEQIKAASVTLLKQALIGVAIKWLPALASGPFNYVLVKLMTKLAEELAQRGELLVFFKYIDMRTDGQAKDFEAAMVYNHSIQITGTKEEKEDAEKKLEIALNKLVTLSI